MGVNQGGESTFNEQAVMLQTGWGEQAAYWISLIASPPVTATATAALGAFMLATRSAWLWAIVYSLLAVLVPTLYVAWLLYRGQVSDIHLTVREQRTRPLILTLTAAVATWGMLHVGAAPIPLLALAGANVVQALLFLGITMRWKISAHSAAAGTLAVLALLLIGRTATPLVMGVPLIAWARIRLRQHTLGQTVAGAALGSSILATMFLIYGG